LSLDHLRVIRVADHLRVDSHLRVAGHLRVDNHLRVAGHLRVADREWKSLIA